MITKILLSTFALFSLMTCQSQKTATAEKLQKPSGNVTIAEEKSKASEAKIYQKMINLKEGESVFIDEAQMSLTFKNIKNDSRCPEGVNCIWAGAATALVEVMSTTSRPELMEISTITDTGKSLANTQSAFGLNMSLVALTPYPTKNKGKDQLTGKYQISLKIEKGKPVPSVKTRQATTK